MDPREVLTAITHYAQEQRRDPRFRPQEMAANDHYIRVGGLGYRSVSLGSDTPLCRHAGGPTSKLDKVFSEFGKPPMEMNVDPQKKEERCLQRFIIKASLLNARDMRKALALTESPYDELLFATDEVALGKVRCDILAVGRIDGNYYPVVIELKSSRDKTRLINQLNDFCGAIMQFQAEFNELLSCIIALDDIRINTATPHKIIVWPIAESESTIKETVRFGSSCNAQKTRNELVLGNGISLLEYDNFDNRNDSIVLHQTWIAMKQDAGKVVGVNSI